MASPTTVTSASSDGPARCWYHAIPVKNHTFAHIDTYIIGNGGQIFLAIDNSISEVVGCCALINHPEKNSYELAKMAVSPHIQGQHIGYQLGSALIEYAQKLGVKRIYLEDLSSG